MVAKARLKNREFILKKGKTLNSIDLFDRFHDKYFFKELSIQLKVISNFIPFPRIFQYILERIVSKI